MEQQQFDFKKGNNMPDYKDSVINELKERLDKDHKTIEHKDVWIKAAENRCDELAAELYSATQKMDEQKETIRQLKKERDFYQGAKMERESTYSAIDELVQARAAIQAEGAARSEILHTGLSQIPLSALRKIGSIFIEGQLKYGRDNWKKGAFNKTYQRERAEHALVHFLEYLHQESNDGSTPIQQLAKVAWFCVTQIDTLERESTEELMQ